MAAEGPGRQPDVDEEFARIVAGWSEVAPTSGSSILPPSAAGEPPDPAGPAPAGESGGEADAGEAQQGGRTEPGEAQGGDLESGIRPAAPPDREPWRGYLPEEPDEHFEPPEPQLPPAHDATYWLAVLGLVGGPLLILWAVVLSGNPDPGWSVVAGIVLTVGGFGLLVLRGSGERDPDDDGSRL